MREILILALPFHDFSDCGIEDGEVAECEVQLAAVFLGDVDGVDEGFEGFLHVGMREDEDLGGSDWVEPVLDPAPEGGEEGGGATDLRKISASFSCNSIFSDLSRVLNWEIFGRVNLRISYPASPDNAP